MVDDTWQYILDKYGYDPATVDDLTESSKIKLDEPSCAYVNITGIGQMPTKKNQNLQAWLEFYDGGSNYFKKRAVLNAQGNSSMHKDTSHTLNPGQTESELRDMRWNMQNGHTVHASWKQL